MNRATLRPHGFTLIELLIVMAVICLLAALLFPVLSRVRVKAGQTDCISNFRQITASMLMYAQDDDEVLPRERTGNPNKKGPVGHIWPQLIFPYVKDWRIFACPDDPNANDLAYLSKLSLPANTTGPALEWARAYSTDFGYNRAVSNSVSLAQVSRQTTTILGADSSSGVPYDNSKGTGSYYIGGPDINHWTLSGPLRWYDQVAPRHSDYVNVAFVDGHVKPMTIDELTAGYDFKTQKVAEPNAYLWDSK